MSLYRMIQNLQVERSTNISHKGTFVHPTVTAEVKEKNIVTPIWTKDEEILLP